MAAFFPVVIHHNPQCSASRATLELILGAGHEPVVIEYLKTGWTRGYLQTLFAAAGLTARQALREKEGAALKDASEDVLLKTWVPVTTTTMPYSILAPVIKPGP